MNNKILESSDVQMNNNEKSLKKINENSIFYKLKNFFTRFFNFIGKERYLWLRVCPAVGNRFRRQTHRNRKHLISDAVQTS